MILPSGILLFFSLVLVLLVAVDRMSVRDALVVFIILLFLLLLFGGLRTA